jgi:hypothetical protein
MAEVTIVRELDGWKGSACLVEMGGEFFIVSSISSAPDHGGPETLVFPSNPEGEVSSFGDVAGGRGVSREQAISELSEKGPAPDCGGRGMYGDTKPLGERSLGEIVGVSLESMISIAKKIGKD